MRLNNTTKMATTLLLAGALLGVTACGGPAPKHEASRHARLPNLHPIIHREGIPPVARRFQMPETSDLMDRRVWLEDRYPWLKNPQQEYSMTDTPFQNAVEGLVPSGVHIYWGDVDREKVISFDFSAGDLYTMLRSVTREAGANFDVVSHNGEVGIYVTNHETYQTTIAAPDVLNQYTGMNGNMLTALGSMGGYGGGMGMGGYGGGMGLGGMAGGMGGSGGGQSSAGLLMVTSSSGMQTFWQDLTTVLNGLASGFCSSPLATVASSTTSGMGGSMPGATGMGGPGGGAGGPAGFISPQGYNFTPGYGGAPGGVPGGAPGGAPGAGGPGAIGQNPGGVFGAQFSQAAGAAMAAGLSQSKYTDFLPCGRVKVSPDSGLGYVYAYDKVDNIFRIRQYMEKIKAMLHKQVFLKIDIAEIDLTKQDQYGINWSNVLGKLGVGTNLAFASPSGALASLGTGAASGAAGIAGTSSNYALGVVSGASNSAVLQALSEVTHVHLVNQPRIMTISGPSVTINTTKSTPYLQSEMPFIAGGLSSASEVVPQIGFVPVGVSLVLTPTIRENDASLSLYVAPTLNLLEGFDTINAQGVGTFQEPIVDSRSLSSIINVKSGDTVIFGGLISSTVQKQRWSVPWLGNVLPALFAGYNNLKKTTELVFLITPVIVNDRNMEAVKRDQPSTKSLLKAKTGDLFMRQTPQPGMSAPFMGQ